MTLPNDPLWDLKLKIRTGGRDYSLLDGDNYGYDPTPYSALKYLKRSGLIESRDKVVDFGCGKGRVDFFLNREIGCSCVGVDFDSARISECMANLKSYDPGKSGSYRVSFVCCKAEKYQITDENCFYFFNPFSPEIFKKVLLNLHRSKLENPRSMKVIFYYPAGDYIPYIFQEELLSPLAMVKCRNIFLKAREMSEIYAFTVL
ncbi:MAG: class I SAM-dependent methyltransferase [Lachnospiraceae bacterium]|nr:class I SAM-dependent methyltransferase [Lachnospiraceae bacterium]